MYRYKHHYAFSPSDLIRVLNDHSNRGWELVQIFEYHSSFLVILKKLKDQK